MDIENNQNDSGVYVDVERYRAKRQRRAVFSVLLRVLAVCACVVVIAAAVVIAYASHIDERISEGVTEEVREVLVEEPEDPGDPFYMLLLGIDRDEYRRTVEVGEDDSLYRTDTIILVRVSPRTRQAQLVSIPRDTKVDLGEYGTQKINAAFTYGGAALTIQKVSEIAGVEISHFAEVDLDGFAAILTQIGGLDVYLPVDVYDPYYTGLDLKAGEQHLDGYTAALLGRTRHAYDDYGAGDYYRTANQRMLIQATVQKILSLDPVSMASVIDTATQYITTDVDVSSIVRLATVYVGVDSTEAITTALCPTTGSLQGGIWYEEIIEDEWAIMMDRVKQGLPPYSDEAEQDFTAGVVGVSAEN